MRCSRPTWITLSLLAVVALCAFPPRALADIAGNYKVTVEPDDEARKAGEKNFDDTITFKADKFVSAALKKRDFAECKFDEDIRSFGPSTFTAEQKSDKEGKAKWSGTLAATEMTGELTITKPDGTQLHFTFKGSKS